jgi:hypothetical protein
MKPYPFAPRLQFIGGLPFPKTGAPPADSEGQHPSLAGASQPRYSVVTTTLNPQELKDNAYETLKTDHPGCVGPGLMVQRPRAGERTHPHTHTAAGGPGQAQRGGFGKTGRPDRPAMAFFTSAGGMGWFASCGYGLIYPNDLTRHNTTRTKITSLLGDAKLVLDETPKLLFNISSEDSLLNRRVFERYA